MSFPLALLIVPLLVISSVSAATPLPEPDTPTITYPETRRDDVVDTLFGQSIPDPYRWLEQDVRTDSDVADWVAAQNAVTDTHLESLPGRDVFRERLTEHIDHEQFSLPQERGGRYFYAYNPGLANQASLMLRDEVDGDPRVLIDPNQWSEDGATALAEWAASSDGSRVAYAVQEGGTDWRTIKIIDVDTGQILSDEVKWARFTTMVWAEDGSGFFYSRYPEPAPGTESLASVANHAVYFHAVGTPQEEDRPVHATPDRPEMLHIPEVTDGGRYAVVHSTPGFQANSLTVVDLESDDWESRTLFPELDAEWTVAGTVGSTLYLVTSKDADQRKIVTLNLEDPTPTPVDLVAEDEVVLSDARLVGDRLIARYFVDVQTEVRRFTLDGTPDGVVELPGIGTTSAFQGRPDSDEAFYIFTSFNVPLTLYRYDVAANTSTVWAAPDVEADLARIVVEQHFYPSKDGTSVPMFIVRRDDVTGPAPTMLYGYGGFGISIVPAYTPLELAWIEQGGVFAVANIRGGGEYGKPWHDAARLEGRQNAFDDFIAAAEYLYAEEITSPGGLVINGESNGGLLVGAVVNQRPDLYGAALVGVGVLDMLRFDKFTGGTTWIGEFGDPANEEHFRNLLTYSPYHTIADGEDYPAILATTADTDNRVVPAHTFKYVAALQAADIGDRPHLARIETRAGHGAGKPTDTVIEETTDKWAFAAYWTGLAVEPYTQPEP